ncbi:hypothetical protein L6270_02915 [Candidatus Parcubacteria bacterium]|nr:hypothetical protein [Patescibacteria group bacterium]MBU4308912.1 hypothetical protein [Patescibacteria group bacterium]MBU4432586.1 hypothetical protein [Patescibacteria group bacterium]MBU4577272.1 hypothetical protein [Patescibacteria group bacterium]MCG2696962.1 hypothetical protein [Candidatus Parcubacteria bacterium]
MKKTFIFLSLIIAVVFLTTACSKNTGNSQDNVNSVGDKNTTTSSAGRRPDGVRMPDFGQPDRAPDTMGIVKSIVGNEITILKIERPNGGQGSATSTEQKRSLNLSGATGVPGSGAGLSGGMRGASGGTVDRAQMLENMKKQSTGEMKIIIPVGIKMLITDAAATANAGTPPKMNEATLADVKQDKMLNIWLNQDVKDQSVAEFVFVR